MFEEMIVSNKRKTFLLIAIFVLIVAVLSVSVNYLIGGGLIGLILAFAFTMFSTWGAYWKSDAIALSVNGAIPADPQVYARLHNLVEGLCIASGLPKPRIYVVDDPAPNAFATGRNPKNAAIAVTTGLLEKMNRVELEGVLAHEMSHIKNYDILVMTLAVTMVGTVVILSDFAFRMSLFGGARRRNNNSDNGAGVILLVVGVLAMILAPLCAKLLQFAISRNRESLADASAVQMTRYPPGLISALNKLRTDSTVVHHGSQSTAHMWIESPLEADSGGSEYRKFNKLFMTHPPIEERIAALREM